MNKEHSNQTKYFQMRFKNELKMKDKKKSKKK